MSRLALILCAALLSAIPAAAEADGLKVVIFPIEPVEMPNTPAVRTRLTGETELLRTIFTKKGFTVVDTTPQDKKIADNSPLSQCNGCDQDIAKALGADLEIATAAQQSSSAIYNLSGSVKDVSTNRTLREGVVDIRGDADDVWNHGIKFLVNERMLEPPLPTDAAALRKLVDGAPKPK